MSRPKTEDLQKHTLNLRKGDVDAIRALFPRKDATVVIRRIVSKFVDKTRQVEEQPVTVTDLEI